MEDKYYRQIKDLIIDTEVTIKVKDYSKNRVVLENYYEIGKMIVEAQGGEERAKYGDGLIKEYSKKLTIEFGKKYSITLLKCIRQFYFFIKKGPTLSDKLDWSHYVEMIWINDINEINYYIDISNKYNLTVRQLREKIKTKEYDKLSNETKLKLIENKKVEPSEIITDPIIINNPSNIEVIKEKILKKLILEDLDNFLRQLGNVHYVGNEYKIKIGNRYNYIDLLLYNIEYECYIVVELKIGELKKEHLGQIDLYMNYIDKHKRKINTNKTIGIILCHKNNKLVMEYCSNKDIISREYVLN